MTQILYKMRPIFSLALFRFPEYNFISDNNISKSAGLTSRYSEASLHGIILDIHFLANADFLVCTFSSQVSAFGFFIPNQSALVDSMN